jgi:diguanylate cyclase (GGDEF)-like protein
MIEERKTAIQYEKGVQVLFEASYRVIPFNVVLALLLYPGLIYNNVPRQLVDIWLAGIILIGFVRWFNCKQTLKKIRANEYTILSLRLFTLLTVGMGAMWGSIYFISYHYLIGAHENIILLVFGGISAGALSSLSVYTTAYLAYILSMLIPVIAYNYWLMGLEQIILASMTLVFVFILIIESKANEKLFKSTFRLTEEKEFLIDKLEKLSITDALTGLYNRRFFNNKLSEEYNRAKRNKYHITLVSIDVDNFKLINDNLGHPYGDKFLAYAADLFVNTMKRANDTVFRLGGDEFVAILANSTAESTKLVCEKIKDQFKLECFPPLNNKAPTSIYQETLGKVSLSIGVIDVSYESSVAVEDIITRVDKALYEAKNSGKNKIIYDMCN